MATTRTIVVAIGTTITANCKRHRLIFFDKSSSSLLTKQKLNPSLQTLNFPPEISSAHTAPLRRNLSDDYITVKDVPPTDNAVLFPNPNPPTEYSPTQDWYGAIPSTPTPVLSKPDQSSYPFTFSQTQTATPSDYAIPTYAQPIEDYRPSSSFSADAPISSESTSKYSTSSTKTEWPAFVDDTNSSPPKKKEHRKFSFSSSSKKEKTERKNTQIAEEVSCSSA